MSNLAKYGSYSEDAAAKEKESLQGGGNFMKLEVGKNVVRFLPPAPGRRSPFRTVYQHYIRVPGQQQPVVFTCPRMEAKERCKACEKGQRLQGSANKADRDMARDYFPSRRIMANVLNRKDEDAGAQVLGFGKMVHEELIEIRENNGDFTHPLEGFDITITRTGTGKNDTRYKVTPSRDNTQLSETVEKMEEILEGMIDLDQFAKIYSDEELEAKMKGEDVPASAGRLPSNAGESSGGGSGRNVQDDVVEGEIVEEEEEDEFPF